MSHIIISIFSKKKNSKQLRIAQALSVVLTRVSGACGQAEVHVLHMQMEQPVQLVTGLLPLPSQVCQELSHSQTGGHVQVL